MKFIITEQLRKATLEFLAKQPLELVLGLFQAWHAPENCLKLEEKETRKQEQKQEPTKKEVVKK